MKYDFTLEIVCYRDFKGIEAKNKDEAELKAIKIFKDSIKEDQCLYYDEEDIGGINFKKLISE